MKLNSVHEIFLKRSWIVSWEFYESWTVPSSKMHELIVYELLFSWTVPFNQWRNVISGGPRFKIFEGPPSTSAKGTSRAPYMHEFSRGSRASSPGKVLNLESLKCHFPDFGEWFYRILMVRKRQMCNISEALANVFGGPHLAHWGWGHSWTVLVLLMEVHEKYSWIFHE